MLFSEGWGPTTVCRGNLTTMLIVFRNVIACTPPTVNKGIRLITHVKHSYITYISTYLHGGGTSVRHQLKPNYDVMNASQHPLTLKRSDKILALLNCNN